MNPRRVATIGDSHVPFALSKVVPWVEHVAFHLMMALLVMWLPWLVKSTQWKDSDGRNSAELRNPGRI